MGEQRILDRLLAAAIARLRIADAAYALGRVALPAAGLLAALAIVGMRRFEWPAAALWLCVAPLPLALGWALLHRHDRRSVARRLDAFHHLNDQLGAALELTIRDRDAPRTRAIVELARARGEALAATVDPRPATPIRLPRPQWQDAIGPAALLVALLVPPAQAGAMVAVPFVFPEDFEARALARAKVDMAAAAPLRQSLRELVGTEDRPAHTAQQILEILDALERGELDRAVALERLEQLEQELADAEADFQQDLQEDPGILSEALEELAGALEEQEITQPAGEALDQGDGERAEEALAEAEQAAEADADAEAQMSRALSEAERRLGAQQQDRSANSESAKKLDEAERRLRREEQTKPKPEDAAEHERRLKQQREQVEQLRRQHERELAAQKKVEELRRNAADAAKSKAGSAERKRKLEKLGRGMSQASRTAGGSRRLQGARDALEEAKSLVRRAGQQGSGADKRRQQFRKFEKAAKGKGDKGGQDGKGKDGKGKGRSTLMVEGEVGDGEPNAMVEMDGQSGDGQGQDGDGQDGDGQGQDGDKAGDGQTPGDGQRPGDGIGTGSQDPLGEPSAMDVKTKSVRVKAKGGRGVSKAEIMRDASQRGFATEAYRETFRDYRDHAQSALDSDAFPAAQRRLVKRYYQLIQGR